MADNTDEEHLDNPTNNKSENSPVEIISTNDSETINQNQESAIMEVHHHAHHEGNKNWKSYFWEFVMLFLAVFCGFLAEYKLEHVIESEREKELASNFYNELKADSSTFQIAIGNRQRKDAAFNYMKRFFADSNVALCSKAFSVNFFYAFATFSPSIFEPNDAILTQLKNSGSLRYFKDHELQELTGKISVAISNLRKRNDMELSFNYEFINPFYIKHNDPSWNDKILRDSSVFALVTLRQYESSDKQIPFHFQKLDNFDRVEAINTINLCQLTFRGTWRKQYHDYEILNAKLLEALRKEYNLK
ncbi:MAG: hypothetical protein WBP41_00420 [Saprospiraceae bacterium]